MGTVTQPSSSGLGGDGSACEDWSLIPEELGCEKNPFLEMSQDQIQKLDAVLSSEQAKALLQETTHRQLLDEPEEKLVAVLGGAPGNQNNQESSQTQLPLEVMDLDNLLGPKPDELLNVLEQASGPDLFPGTAEEDDVANMAKEFLGSDIDESVLELDVVLLDHCYSMLPADFVKPSHRIKKQETEDVTQSVAAVATTSAATVVSSSVKEEPKVAETIPQPTKVLPVATKTPEISPAVKPSPVRRSQRQIDKIEREQLEKIKAENAEMQRREREEMEKLKALQQQEGEQKDDEENKPDAIKAEDSREFSSTPESVQKSRLVSRGKGIKGEDSTTSDKDYDGDVADEETPKKGKRGKTYSRRSTGKRWKDVDSQDEQKESDGKENEAKKSVKGSQKKEELSTDVEKETEVSEDEEEEETSPVPKGRKKRGRGRVARMKERHSFSEDDNKSPEPKSSLSSKKFHKNIKHDVEAAVERLHASPKRNEKGLIKKKKVEKVSPALKKNKKELKDMFAEKGQRKEKILKRDGGDKILAKKLGKKFGNERDDRVAMSKGQKILKKGSHREVLSKGLNKSPELPGEKLARSESLKKQGKSLAKSDKHYRKRSESGESSARIRKISEADSAKSEASDGSSEIRKVLSKKEIHKKAFARRESLQMIPAELEPALFSTPDVMVKKRSASMSQEGASLRKDSMEKDISEELGSRKDSSSESPDEKNSIKLDASKKDECKDGVKDVGGADNVTTEYAETVADIEKAIRADVNKIAELEAGTGAKEMAQEKLDAARSTSVSESLASISTKAVVKQEVVSVQKEDILVQKVQPKEKERSADKRLMMISENRTSKSSDGNHHKERRHSAGGNLGKKANDDRADEKRKRHPDMVRRLKKKSDRKTTSPRKGSAAKQKKREGKEAASSGEEISYSDNPDDSDWCSEDDPDRPWCICRKPHDDRFMICCDRCHDWFHGSCVGVSRTQGRQWEKEGREWICPRCPKMVPQVKEEKIVPVKQEKVVHVEKPERKQTILLQTPSIPERKNHQIHSSKPLQVLKCTFGSCGKPVMPGSAFCGAECLEKHAKDALNYMQQKKEKPESGKSGTPSEKRILVIDRQSNRLVTGPNAPTEANLIEWLRSHPNFAVVKPGASKPPAKTPTQSPTTVKTETIKTPPVQAQPKPSDSNNTSGPDPVRLNVRKTLRDALAARCKDADDILLSTDEVKNIAVRIEEALFKLFKDIGSKYKARYRSLVFNIKDIKNQGLFRKILRGKIQPDCLVKMSPEELASQELAKWRERETKHALEMIQREQLEQQQQQSGHVIKKTHKGEVEIEDENLKLFELAEGQQKLSVPPDNSFSDNLIDTTENHRSHLFDLNCKICTGKIAPPSDEPAPKKARVARTILVDSSPVQQKEESPATPKQKVEVKPKLPPAKKPSVVTEESSDHEPSSTVCLSSPDSVVTSHSEAPQAPPPPPRVQKDKSSLSVWKGFISMQEVSKFVTSAHKVSGPTDFLSQDIPDTIQVCGRISPDQVWDYLSKIKQSGNKELIIIRFQPANDEEKSGYGSLYSYLSTRKRYGVVGNHARMIKDFYIVPLASHSPVPTVLIPFDGPGLDAIRPHLLLGVIVRHKSRQGTGSSHSSRSKASEKYEPYEPSYTPPINSLPSQKSPSEDSPNGRKHRLSESQDPEERSYTPPLEKMPRLTDVDDRKNRPDSEGDQIDDADKPYDPEESDVGLNPSYTTGSNISSVMPSLLTGSAVSNQSVCDLIDQISKSSNPAELTTRMLASIASSTDLEQQKHLLMELTQKVEEQKRQLEQERLRTLGVALNLTESISKARLSPSGSRCSNSNTPLYSETSNPSADPFSTALGTTAKLVTTEAIAASASSISLPPKLQEMLDTVRKKSMETQPLPKMYSPKEHSSQPSILVDDPIVKKYSVTPDDMGDVDLRVLPFAPVPSKETKETLRDEKADIKPEIAAGAAPSADKRTDPRLKGKSYQQDPRTKSTSSSKEQDIAASSSGGSLSAMSASELVEKAKKQLEEMEAMEKAQQVTTAQPVTVPPPNFGGPLISSDIQSQQPPPPGVDPVDLVQSTTHSTYSAPPMVKPQESLTPNMTVYQSSSLPVSGFTSHSVGFGYSTTSGTSATYHSNIGPPASPRTNNNHGQGSGSIHVPTQSTMPPPLPSGAPHGYCAPPFAPPFPPSDGNNSGQMEGWWGQQGSSSLHKQDRDERRQWNQGWRRREWSQRKDGTDRRPQGGSRWSRDREGNGDRDFRNKGWHQHNWQKQNKSSQSEDKNKDKDWRPKRKE